MSHNSRNLVARLGIASALVLLACYLTNAQDVRTNYMPETDWSKYRTYAWVDEVQGLPNVGGHPDQILDTQVKQAIDSQMTAKGFMKLVDAGKPDLLVGYQLMIDREKQINGFRDTRGGWGGWGPWTLLLKCQNRLTSPAFPSVLLTSRTKNTTPSLRSQNSGLSVKRLCAGSSKENRG